MAIVLQTQLLLDPNNQIAHLADYTGLDVEQEYLISAPFLQADTRFHFLGYFDIALSRPPLNVPQAQTEVPATISTVPLPAVATPPAAYPFALNDRLASVGLNAAFENTPGVAPPNGNGGTSHLGRIWLDTSGGANTHLRMCKVPTASSGYVAAEWADLFQINTGSGQIQVPGVTGQFVRLTGDQMTGNLTITKDYPALVLQVNTGTAAQILGMRGSSLRWYIEMPNAGAETGLNAGSDFALGRCADNGGYLGTALYIHRDSGDAVFSNNLSALAYQLSGTTFATRSAVHTTMYNAAGQPALYLGSASDLTNYYDNNSHVFRSSNHSTNLAVLNGSSFTVNVGTTVPALAVQGGGITSTGNISANGSAAFAINGVAVLLRGGGATQLYDGSGGVTLTLYADANYYQSTSHLIQSRAGAAYATFQASGATVYNYLNVVAGASNNGSAAFAGSVIVGLDLNVYRNSVVQGFGQFFQGLYVSGSYSGDGGGHSIYSPGAIYGNTIHGEALRARSIDGGYNLGIYSGSGLAYLNFHPSIYISWNSGNGELVYVNGNGAHLYCRATDGLIWNQQNAMAGFGAYQNLSDRRFKENIIPTTRGLAEILALVPVEYNRTTPIPSDAPPVERPLEIGFVAQDVYEVLPEAVWIAGVPLPDGTGTLEDPEPTLALTSETIVAALVNAMKTLDQRLTALEIAK